MATVSTDPKWVFKRIPKRVPKLLNRNKIGAYFSHGVTWSFKTFFRRIRKKNKKNHAEGVCPFDKANFMGVSTDPKWVFKRIPKRVPKLLNRNKIGAYFSHGVTWSFKTFFRRIRKKNKKNHAEGVCPFDKANFMGVSYFLEPIARDEITEVREFFYSFFILFYIQVYLSSKPCMNSDLGNQTLNE